MNVFIRTEKGSHLGQQNSRQAMSYTPKENKEAEMSGVPMMLPPHYGQDASTTHSLENPGTHQVFF